MQYLAPIVIIAFAMVLAGCDPEMSDDTPGEETVVVDNESPATSPISTQPTQVPAISGASTPTNSIAATSRPGAPVATSTAQPPEPTTHPSGELRVAVGTLGTIDSYFFDGRTFDNPQYSVGGVMENLFWWNDGDPMAPLLAESWSVGTDGLQATIKLREGVPWNAPFGQTELDLGYFDAHNFATWLNLSNAATNPESSHFNRGDYAASFLESRALDDYTIQIDLTSPNYFSLPLLSESGLYGGGYRSVTYVKAIEKFGLEWGEKNPVGTGPYVVDSCIEDGPCVLRAVPNHWRKTANIELVHLIPTNRADVVAHLKNGTIDISTFKHHGEIGTLVDDGLKYFDQEGWVGQSIAWSGNLWESEHALTLEPLEPWLSPAYDTDLPWIGDPWQESHPDKVRYIDTDNPAGMTDMEQARLVRLALSDLPPKK